MAVKKNARREIAASINKTAGSCWEDSGNSWDRKTAPQFPIDAAKNLLGSRTKSAKVLYHKEHKEHKESNVRRATGVNPWVYY